MNRKTIDFTWNFASRVSNANSFVLLQQLITQGWHLITCLYIYIFLSIFIDFIGPSSQSSYTRHYYAGKVCE